MGDQHPLDPFVDFEAILDAVGDAPLIVPEVGSEEPTNLRRSAGEGEKWLWKGVLEISRRTSHGGKFRLV